MKLHNKFLVSPIGNASTSADGQANVLEPAGGVKATAGITIALAQIPVFVITEEFPTFLGLSAMLRADSLHN